VTASCRCAAAPRAAAACAAPGQTVFGPHYAKSEPDKISYYHHAALQMRFRRFDGCWHCQLEPDYCFTSDGYAESRFATTCWRASSAWTGIRV